MVTRKQIVEEVRSWLNTPFIDQARIKGLGIDCVGLPLMCAVNLGLRDKLGNLFKPDLNKGYSSQYLDGFVLAEAKRLMVEKPPAEMREGDVLILRMPIAPCHAAVVTKLQGGFGMVHAYSSQPAKVVEHALDEKWKRRIAGVFSFPEVQS